LASSVTIGHVVNAATEPNSIRITQMVRHETLSMPNQSIVAMKKNRLNSIRGAEGVYRVAALLSKYNIHVAPTMGNASCVDLLAASEDGAKSIAIQVKSAGDGHANRNKYIAGQKIAGKYWLIGRRPPIWSNELWYAFVDLDDVQTGIYFIPSKWVAAFCSGIKNVNYFFIPISVAGKAQSNLNSLLEQIAGKGCPVDIPKGMIWVGENEGKTTRQVIQNLKLSRW